MVHATFTNATLAALYPTVELLRDAPELEGFLRWVRKQPPTRSLRSRTMTFRPFLPSMLAATNPLMPAPTMR